MSFGWAAGDILAGIDLVKTVIKAIKSGPSEYREIHRELSSLNIALSSVQDGVDDSESLLNRKGRPRKQELLDILANCRIVVIEVQGLVDQHSSLQGHGRTLRRVWDAYRVGSADLDTLRGRLTFYTSTIDMFLHSLEGPALARIEGMVRLLVANMGISQAVPGSGSRSIASVASTATILSIFDPDQEDEAWKFLRAELMAEGILPSHLKMYKVDIIGYVKTLIEEVEMSVVSPVSTQASEPVKRDLHLENVPTPKPLLPITSVVHEWIQDGAGLFEYKPVVVKHGVWARHRSRQEADRAPVCVFYIEVRALASFHWGPERAVFQFSVDNGSRSIGSSSRCLEYYPNSVCSLVYSQPWTVSRIRPELILSRLHQDTADWTLDSMRPAVSQRPGTFRLAMLFFISEIDLGMSASVDITLRCASLSASGMTGTLQKHTTRLVAVPETSNDSFNDFLGAQEIKEATHGVYAGL
jgi:hypothetical protein